MAVAPTAAEIRAASRLDFAAEGYAEDQKLADDVVGPAVSWLTYVTGRTYAQAQTDSFPAVKDMLDMAVRMRSEQIVLQARLDQLETAADFDIVAKLSAGLYSETRRGLGDYGKERPLNPWPALNDLLWMLLGLFPGETNDQVLDRYDYWLALLKGINAPAWQVVETDWGRGMGLDDWPSFADFNHPAGWLDTRLG